MKRWLIFGGFVAAYVVIPVYINWLRHRPRLLKEPTQHIVLLGMLAQVVVLVLVGLIWWLV